MDELRAISQKSVEVLNAMAPRAQWVQSFVTDDHIFCVYLADDAVHEVRAVIDPTTADAPVMA